VERREKPDLQLRTLQGPELSWLKLKYTFLGALTTFNAQEMLFAILF